MRSPFAVLASLALGINAAPALAEEEGQLWFTQSVARKLSSDNDRLLLEVNERIRSERFGGNQFETGLFYSRPLTDGVRGGVGVIYSHSGSTGEYRLAPEVELSRGILRARTRLEIRSVEGIDPLQWRIRQRVGVSVPTGARGLSANLSAEAFFALNSARPGGSTGFNAVRTIATLQQKVSDTVSVLAGYVRQHDIRRNAEDRIGNAAYFALALSF